MISFVFVKASEGREGEDELQSASLLPRCVKQCFVFIPLARFPFLLSQVFVFVVKPMENHTFWHQPGSPNRPSFGAAGQVLWALSGRVLWELSGAPLGSSSVISFVFLICPLSGSLWCELRGAERSEVPRSGSSF